MEFPEDRLTIDTNPNGTRTRIIACSGFYLKDGCEVAPEKASECKVEAHVRYMRNAYYYVEKSIYTHLDECSYEIRKNSPNPEGSISHDEMLEGTYENGQYFIYMGYDTVLTTTTAKLLQNIKLLSASGTLYLYA